MAFVIADLLKIADRIILSTSASAAVVIDQNLQVQQFRCYHAGGHRWKESTRSGKNTQAHKRCLIA